MKLTISGECSADAYALKCGSGWICCYSCPHLPSPFIPYPAFSRRSSMSIGHMGNREESDNAYRSTTLHPPSKHENQSSDPPHKTHDPYNHSNPPHTSHPSPKKPQPSHPRMNSDASVRLLCVFILSIYYSKFLCMTFSVFVKCELNETNAVVGGLQNFIC